MKIGITCYPTIGGSGIVATELGKMLAERGHEVHFISSSLPFRLEHVDPNIYFHEVEVNHYQVFRYPPYDLALASKMAEVIDHESLDVLHVHYAVPHAVCAKLAKDMARHPVKVVTTLHGTDITVLADDPSLKSVIRYGINNSDAVTAVSDSLALQTKDIFHTEVPIETVHNFVDPRLYDFTEQPLNKAKFGIQDDEAVIVHMSNFRPVKRTPDVLEAFHMVRQKQKAKLLLIGDGPERSVVMDEAAARGLEEDVLFLGSQRQVPELLQLADVMLLLSEKESFGLAALEAMAVGVPVVGTNIGGIPEVIVDQETGYIVPLGAAEEAARCTLELLTSPNKAELMGAGAKDRAVNVFSAEVVVSQYEAIYERQLNVDSEAL
ncbi:N-acetyl-alpha-D-glucosaminyl L-malate synthase BshA [Salsuginibacillus halophilus]|uniref:N-acetyl-alpha-D-glucosaminyl L-malate synthase BshA n=1 Tax=Salsuginibacillus halophilus TaxID=517424 RepID=A0A2P8HWG9_9BACI|nr:N-acetyl-alpha-D-glucosaminyl L-malate synthase BshA [Salsuginibacillus halophilus]PSL50528.1 N-acetyl-alpha-D-glucosaminyl L-malate synthase BshA [Salsuginibacillus halophilus]